MASNKLTGVGVKLDLNDIQLDLNLVFMIQLITKETTEEIIGSLYENVNTIITECMKVTRARQLNKICKIFYKNTQIPIQIEVYSAWLPIALAARGNYVDPNKPVTCQVKIGFYLNVRKIEKAQLDIIASERFESSIGLADRTTLLENVPPPVIKLPKVLKGVL